MCVAMPPYEGPEKLSQFLQAHGLTQRAAASAVGVSAPTMHDWITGAKRPSSRHRESIERWTNGEVAAAAWATEDEQQAVRAIEPFRPEAPKSGTDNA
jgi:DNA-binding transcriptional regulator YdaS (Cro superfamily)